MTSSGLATAQKVDKRLIFVPVIFILLRIWGTIRTMLDIADSGHHPESWFHNNTLRLLHVSGATAKLGDAAISFALYNVVAVQGGLIVKVSSTSAPLHIGMYFPTLPSVNSFGLLLARVIFNPPFFLLFYIFFYFAGVR